MPQRRGASVMTIKVYEVRPDGTTRMIRQEREVEPTVLSGVVSGSFPPCSCPRCRHVAAR
ncbi:hypothetical protein [Streptomyces lavendulocolor]|uniref:hypothetical protein n=1 Tax=Streptomyces lavendulocolor TaxID=67316 RepID=UPI003C3074E3